MTFQLLRLWEWSGEDDLGEELGSVLERHAGEVRILRVMLTGWKLLQIFSWEIMWLDHDSWQGRNWLGVVQVLPSDDSRVLGLVVRDGVQDIFDQLDVVDLLDSDIVVGKLMSVLVLGDSPEELDAHQVGTIR